MEETRMVPCFKMECPIYAQLRQWRTSRYPCLLWIISFYWLALWDKISRFTTCTFDCMSLIFQKSFKNNCILTPCLLRKPGIPLKLCSILSVCSSSLVFSFSERKQVKDIVITFHAILYWLSSLWNSKTFHLVVSKLIQLFM